MGKRSNFVRIERDFYPTPRKAVEPLADWFNDYSHKNEWFAEPCYGAGDLADHLQEMTDLRLGWASDIAPEDTRAKTIDVFDLVEEDLEEMDWTITNPPWSRDILHPLIHHLMDLNQKTWLLFDADWMHTVQAKEFLPYLDTIISVGRIKWIEGSKYSGKDNCCWYYFHPEGCVETQFIGRS